VFPAPLLSRLVRLAFFPLVIVFASPKGASAVNSAVTADEVRHLPAALTVIQAARVLRIGRSSAYQAVQAGTWPTRVVRVGRSIRIPAAEVLALLGIQDSREDNGE
jgi:excisionase family DNA binding protein